MTTSQLVAQHVPYLRRYARVLTGNQASGDSYVAATLEALVKEPKRPTRAETEGTSIFCAMTICDKCPRLRHSL